MYDLVVIGGGSGGLTIGKYGARLGAAVAIVESARLGGDCTWSGCVPSKALIASARAAHDARRTQELGLPLAEFREPIDLGQIADRIRRLQEQISQQHDDPDALRASGCDIVEGRARFVSPHEIDVANTRIRARAFCIATGSQPQLPPIAGLESVDYWTNLTVFEQRRLPERLLVVGGGPIGLELGQAFARLGARVTIVEALPRILASAAPEAAELLADCLRGEGIDLRTETLVESVTQPDGPGTTIDALLRGHDGPATAAFDALLIATGRRPNVDDLGLDAAGVEYRDTGIVVDETLRTTNPAVFAIGDVAGRHAFTHTAAYEASIVLRNALFPMRRKADETAIPSATFTDPEVAQVGLSEAEARARWSDVRSFRYDFAESDRAVLDGTPHGFCTIVTRGRKQRIVGAQIIGPAAGELIHEFVIALRGGMTAADVAQSIHVYPTLSQVACLAAMQAYEEWLGSASVQWLRRGHAALRRVRDRLSRSP